MKSKPCKVPTEICCLLLQITPVDWPFEEGGNGSGAKEQSIADYLATKKFDLVINLPLRSSGARRASTYFTHGYKTRRMAIDYSVPLITDIKCAKLFIEVIFYHSAHQSYKQELIDLVSPVLIKGEELRNILFFLL